MKNYYKIQLQLDYYINKIILEEILLIFISIKAKNKFDLVD